MTTWNYLFGGLLVLPIALNRAIAIGPLAANWQLHPLASLGLPRLQRHFQLHPPPLLLLLAPPLPRASPSSAPSPTSCPSAQQSSASSSSNERGPVRLAQPWPYSRPLSNRICPLLWVVGRLYAALLGFSCLP